MATYTEALRIKNAKQSIKSAIECQGVPVSDELRIDSYAPLIESIGRLTPPDPVEVYNNTRPADWLPMPMPQDDEMYMLFHIPDGCSSLLAFTITCIGAYTVALGTVVNEEFIQYSSVSIASGKPYETELFAADYGNLTSNGMKQVMIKVSGIDILTFSPSSHSKRASSSNFAAWNIVEISCRLPKSTRLLVGRSSPNLALEKLVYFSMYGPNMITNMSVMFYYCHSLVAVPFLDTSMAINMNGMFTLCAALVAIPEFNTSNVTNMKSMFNQCYSLKTIPDLDTSQVTNMSSMFSNCYCLVSVPQMNTQNVTDMSYMFSYCWRIVLIPMMDTRNVVNMNCMLRRCPVLSAVPPFETQNVTNMNNMFDNCKSLTKIPFLDTSNVTSMLGMFKDCTALITVPPLDTSRVTDMTEMFNTCNSLSSVGFLDTSSVTNMSKMFNFCQNLITIPQLDTSNVTNMNNMFASCYALSVIPPMDTTNVTDMENMFLRCRSLHSILFDSAVSDWEGCDLSFIDCSMMHTDIIAFFNSLPTITSSKTITLTGNPGANDLTDAEKAIATEKGWTLTI